MTIKIRIISDNFCGNEYGDIITIEYFDDDSLFYSDRFDRYCFVERYKEEIDFEYVLDR